MCSMYPVLNIVLSESAFDIRFSKEQNCEVWKKVDVAPLTQAHLQNHNQVCQEMGDTKDTTNNTMQLIQSTKRNKALTVVCSRLQLRRQTQTISVRPSQELIDAFSKATTNNNLFHAIGGGHLIDEDVFLTLPKKKVGLGIEQLKKQKDAASKMGDVRERANAILEHQKLYTTYNKAKLSVCYHTTR